MAGAELSQNCCRNCSCDSSEIKLIPIEQTPPQQPIPQQEQITWTELPEIQPSPPSTQIAVQSSSDQGPMPTKEQIRELGPNEETLKAAIKRVAESKAGALDRLFNTEAGKEFNAAREKLKLELKRLLLSQIDLDDVSDPIINAYSKTLTDPKVGSETKKFIIEALNETMCSFKDDNGICRFSYKEISDLNQYIGRHAVSRIIFSENRFFSDNTKAEIKNIQRWIRNANDIAEDYEIPRENEPKIELNDKAVLEIAQMYLKGYFENDFDLPLKTQALVIGRVHNLMELYPKLKKDKELVDGLKKLAYTHIKSIAQSNGEQKDTRDRIWRIARQHKLDPKQVEEEVKSALI